jgi:DNA helicase-2/ATP-dependent DNA helicase PcrA
MKHILEQLNPAQREAVTTTEGPLLVIAGAGSGKTRVLTSRVAYILGQRLAQPRNILAVTFTNKAANEMKERIARLLGTELYDLNASTFHSFCARLLRYEASAIGFPSNFTIYDEEDSISMLKICIDQLNLSRGQFPPQAMRRKISAAKNKMIDAAAFEKNASGYFESRTAKIYTLYEQRLQECGAFDFDDLIFRTVQLLSGNEAIRQKYQDRFKYILVDEYQDTNHSQYLLLKNLVGPHQNIGVVGDEDQSIYGWRGADITNILNFEKDFSGAIIIKLEQNYRSTNIILDAASAVIANNINRKGKMLWTETESSDLLRLFITEDAADEARYIVDDIENYLNRSPLNETVILYRTNAQSRSFEEILRRKNLPYQIIGGVAFYQRKEIKDLLAYLKLLANLKDDVSLQRIINYPRRGIGATSVERLATFAGAARRSMYEAAGEIHNCPEIGSRAQKLIKDFHNFIAEFAALKDQLNVDELSQKLIDRLRLPELLIEEDPQLGQGRAENIEEFIAAAAEFAESHPEPTLNNYLAEISLYTDIDRYNEIDEKLTLMTLHTAKGLEFKSVYIVGLEEGLFPLARAIENPDELEEERRLFYVGATRAKSYLQLSMAALRRRFGETESLPSRFLKELPPSLVERIECRRHPYYKAEEKTHRASPAETGVHYEYEEEEILRAGRIVQHPTFGRGKVIRAEGHGESLQLEVHFTGIGIKKLIAKYARLKIVG